jgi:NADH-quinone oxidoreductase subunit L
VDEFYHFILVRPLGKLGQLLYCFVHKEIIEGFVQGVPDVIYTGTSVTSDAQSGMPRNYLKLIFLGLVFFGFILFY